MTTGVVIVTYNAHDIIVDCLESLLANHSADLRIVVVDNASSDNTVDVIQHWASGNLDWTGSDLPFTPVDHGKIELEIGDGTVDLSENGAVGLITLKENLGYAGGVNTGLRVLAKQQDIESFWILNPDCMAENHTAKSLIEKAKSIGDFGMIGGRIFYSTPRHMIQSDGGRVNRWSGICIPYNMTAMGPETAPPANETLDYFSGAHMFLSRKFLEQVGYMPENYFLFYEEVDWCMRRGDLPLHTCVEAPVHHHAGHTIGSAKVNQGPSMLAAYFMARNRMKFVARFNPWALPYAFLYGIMKSLKMFLKGYHVAGLASLRGLFGLPPSREIGKIIQRTDLRPTSSKDFHTKAAPETTASIRDKKEQ